MELHVMVHISSNSHVWTYTQAVEKKEIKRSGEIMIAKGHWKNKKNKEQEPLILTPPVEGAIVNSVLDGHRGVYEVYWVGMTSLVEKSMQFT